MPRGTYEKDAELDWPVISTYTTEQAEKDGILVSTAGMNADWADGPFSHITANLLELGYREENGDVRVVNVIDLLNQALIICQRLSKVRKDHLYTGQVELPSGKKQEIFMAQNETGHYTIMLPGDY